MLSARMASGMPGVSFSMMSFVASGVTSDGANPVPPVVRISSASCPSQIFRMGPLINKKQLENVDAAVKNAVKQGAKVLCGGSPDTKVGGGKGYFYKPTVLSDCKQSMDIMHYETFGPVLPICTFKTMDEAIKDANDCEYGLTSSIFTSNTDYMMRACVVGSLPELVRYLIRKLD